MHFGPPRQFGPQRHWLEELADDIARLGHMNPDHRRKLVDVIEGDLKRRFRGEFEAEAESRRAEELVRTWGWVRDMLRDRPAKGDAGGEFRCYASAFDVETAGGVVFARGAFEKAIPSFLASGWLATDHRVDIAPIGIPLDAVEDGRGLLVTGRFLPTPEALECRDAIRRRLAAGEPASCSIGYTIGAEEPAGDRRISVVTEVASLFEVSVCDRGKNPGAKFLSA